MRIAITLQSLDQTWGGIGIYTEEIVKHLLRVDQENEYVLIYPGFGAARNLRGRYRRHKNAIEIETEHSRVPSGAYWDQVIVPKVARQHGIDVLFNPFLSVPIRGRFKKVMILHGVEHHVVSDTFDLERHVRWFLRDHVIIPAADRVISISNVMTEVIRRFLRYPIEQVRTIYHGVSEKFRVISDPERLEQARDEYELAEDFILFVGQLYPQKNFATLVRALHRIRTEIPHRLVVVGRPRWKYHADLDLIRELGMDDRVDFLHFVPNDDLPLIYSLAGCFVYPSLYEAFGLAQLEAMACGCPVIAARAGAIPEICGDAALLFDPGRPEELGEAIVRVVGDPEFRNDLVAKGLAHAKKFTWERCARQTLEVLREVV
jgi:glycosyltransferase involved in cell wall biosynthesis